MTPRTAGLAAAVVLIGLAAMAAWLVGVPAPVIGGCAVLALVVTWRRAVRRPRSVRSGATAGPTDPPQRDIEG